MDADEAGNNTTVDLYKGVIKRETIAESTAAIMETVINVLRLDQMYVMKSVESKLNLSLFFPMIDLF